MTHLAIADCGYCGCDSRFCGCEALKEPLDVDVAAEVAAMGCTILDYHQITPDVATVFVTCSRGTHARDILSWRYEDGAWRLVDFTPHAPGMNDRWGI